MDYHINTTLILDNFKKPCECPLCQIEETVEKWLLKQFLTEAVMEDDARALVNKKGFCAEHLRKLYDGDNKLGFALQLRTRLTTLLPKLSGKPKAAKKTADALSQELSTCVICEMTEGNMLRYAETVADLYRKDAEFRKLFSQGKGFCLRHYRDLLAHSNQAGGMTAEYVEALQSVQVSNMERMLAELDGFARKFDHRFADEPWGNSKDAHFRALLKYQGR